MTNHEMELHYTQNKSIYMEGREPCRIPVPVNRCPLSKLSSVRCSSIIFFKFLDKKMETSYNLLLKN